MKKNKSKLFMPILLILVTTSCLSDPKFLVCDMGADSNQELGENETLISCDAGVKDPDVGVDADKTDTTKDTTQTDCDPACENGEVCDKTENFTCVGCLSDTDCDGNKVCDTDLNTCVDCKDNTLCPDAAASTCTDGTCGACVMDDDCTHIAGLPRCDAGTCKVECEDDSHCGGKVCDVTTNTCTEIDPGLSLQCETCVSDTQCQPDSHCVPLEFPVGTARGNYCLKKLSEGCAQPYGSSINRASLNGAPAEGHCGIKENLTTCEAILSATTAVVTNCEDGVTDMPDSAKCLIDSGAKCEKLALGWTCTYTCTGSTQCPMEISCSSAVDGYCEI